MTTLAIGTYNFECVERGAGPPLLLVHGSASDYRTWQAQMKCCGARYRTVTYSRRYHWPNPPIADGADYAMDQHVDDLAAIIETLDLAPANLVGHSYGAFLSLLLAARRPDLARALVLTEPPAVTLFVSDPPKPLEIARLLVTRPRTAAAVIAFGARGIGPARKAVRAKRPEEGLRIFGEAVLGTDAFRKLTESRWAQARDNLIVAEFLGSGFAPVDEAALRRIDKPVLLVNGEKSPALFRCVSARLEELLPHASRVVVPGASHIVHEDNPAAFDAATLGFLDETYRDTQA